MKSKKLTKVLQMVLTIVVTIALTSAVCYATGSLEGYKGFDELKKMLKDILSIIAGFMAVVGVIFFAYAIIGDRPESKLTALKCLAGGGLMFMLSQGIDRFF